MHRPPALVAALLVVTLAACGSGPVAAPAEDGSGGTVGASRGPLGTPAPPVETATPPLVEEAGSSFGTPHPAFAAHFTDPLYVDEGGEFAPFGTDEGWDLMVSWSARRDELSPCTSVRDLLTSEQAGTGLDDPEQNGPDVDAEIIAAGFGLVHLTGRLDAEGKRATLDALRRTSAVYPGMPELARMTRDLTSFPAEDGCRR